MNSKDRRKLLLKYGLCHVCTEPLGVGATKTRCRSCALVDNTRIRELRAERKARQVCIYCKSPELETKITCAECAEKHRLSSSALRDQRRLANVCTNCTQPNDSSGDICKGCLDGRRMRAKASKDEDAARNANRGRNVILRPELTKKHKAEHKAKMNPLAAATLE